MQAGGKVGDSGVGFNVHRRREDAKTGKRKCRGWGRREREGQDGNHLG